MATLTKDIPGSVYWSNDVNKPKTGAVLADAVLNEADGNQHIAHAYDADGYHQMMQHYHLTCRLLPKELLVEQLSTTEIGLMRCQSRRRSWPILRVRYSLLWERGLGCG